MENNTLLEQFRKLANSKREEILELQTLYLLKQIQNELVQERFKACKNKVLTENPFYAVRNFQRRGAGNEVCIGDRIMHCDHEFQMSDSDFENYLQLCLPEYVNDNLTNEDGTYTEEGNTENQLHELKGKLIRLGVDILPDDFPNKKLLEDAIEFRGYNSYDTREKLFELVMKIR